MPSPSSTGSRRASGLPPAERREAIVAATVPLLMEHGEMVTTRQIAEAAGIAEGTVFRAFADKAEILSAALEAALDMGELDRRLGAISTAAPFEEQLVQATEIYQQRVAQMWLLVSNLGPQLREQARRPLDSSVALTDLFARHRDRITLSPEAASRYLRAVTLASTHPMVSASTLDSRQIVRLFLHGVAAAGSPGAGA
ncbi:MAG: helix-turn-helix domain-containing protein [Acidimicrobiales bacterium]